MLRWDLTYAVLILLIGFAMYSAMHHPMEYEQLDFFTLPAHVQKGLKQSSHHEAFSTYRHGDHTYIVYHLNEPGSYSTLSLKAQKRFTQPIIIATVNHATNDSLVENERAIKLKEPTEKELKFKVVDKR